MAREYCTEVTRRASSSLWPGAFARVAGRIGVSPSSSRRPSPHHVDVSAPVPVLSELPPPGSFTPPASLDWSVAVVWPAPPSPLPPLLLPPPPERLPEDASTGRCSAHRFRIPFRGRRPSRRRRRSPWRRRELVSPTGASAAAPPSPSRAGPWRSRRAASAVSILVAARRACPPHRRPGCRRRSGNPGRGDIHRRVAPVVHPRVARADRRLASH